MYFLTAHGGAILGPIANLFGYLMNGIYLALEKIGIGNIGIAIIIFTLITRLILFPFTFKQQKSSKIMNIIQPELKAIQEKYEGKKDQQSMMQQQAEMKAVYEKYGTSMSGSCVQLLIQMPILFALYRVIMNIPAYVSAIKEKFMVVVDLMGETKAIPTLIKFFEDNSKEIKGITLDQIHKFGTEGVYTIEEQKNFIIDFLYKLNPNQMQSLAANFPDATEQILEQAEEINRANSFLGLNLSTAPSDNGFFSPYILIPILAGLFQYLTVIIMQNQTKKKKQEVKEDDTMQQTMNTMNIMMPIMSAVFCWGFATGLGIYWIATSVFMMLTTMIVNHQLNKLDIDKMLKDNIEKANKKRAKKGLPPINEVKATDIIKKREEKMEQQEKAREEKVANQQKQTDEAEKYYFGDENDKDSFFAKVNMVQKYNEKHNK